MSGGLICKMQFKGSLLYSVAKHSKMAIDNNIGMSIMAYHGGLKNISQLIILITSARTVFRW